MNLRLNTINFRLVEETDAAFINSLRKNKKFNKFLSYVDDNISKQVKWIKEYKVREANEEEYYFIIQRNDNNTPIEYVS